MAKSSTPVKATAYRQSLFSWLVSSAHAEGTTFAQLVWRQGRGRVCGWLGVPSAWTDSAILREAWHAPESLTVAEQLAAQKHSPDKAVELALTGAKRRRQNAQRQNARKGQ